MSRAAYFLLIATPFMVTAHCGRHMIEQRRSPELSAVTMYLLLHSYLIKEVSVKHLGTGMVHTNKTYGWGAERWPRELRFWRVAIGNLPPGAYDLHAIRYYHKGSNGVALFPDGAVRFVVQRSEILHLGDLRIYPDSERSPFPFYGPDVVELPITLILNGVQQRMTLFHMYGPTNDRSAFQPGEEYFLHFFSAAVNQLPEWGRVAKERLARVDEQRRRFIAETIGK